MNKFNKIIMCILNPGFYKAYMNGVAPLFELYPLLNQINQIKTIIDIGSNKGQFLLLGRSIFPAAKIYSFEPQIKYLNLQKVILGRKKIKYFNFGLGNVKKKTNFFITNREDSSSFLKPIQLKVDKYKTKKIVKMSIKRLDKIIKKKEIKRPSIMKLDVQGYELEVLKGSKKILKNIDFIITEISFKQIYKKQTTKKKLLQFLNRNHFKNKQIFNISKLNNKSFQGDALFARNK